MRLITGNKHARCGTCHGGDGGQRHPQNAFVGLNHGLPFLQPLVASGNFDLFDVTGFPTASAPPVSRSNPYP
jgi:hypothetical protein